MNGYTYSGLEEKFNLKTIENIVSLSELQQEFGDGFKLIIPFRGKVVRKSQTIKNKLVPYDCKGALPDFIILKDDQLIVLKEQISLARKGLPYTNPFRWLGCDNDFYIEINGDFYHSGPFVQYLSKEEHDKETIEAYRSAGAEVLILWEDEVSKLWNEVGRVKLNNFLETFKKRYGNCISSNNKTKLFQKNDYLIKSINNPEYWREDLDVDNKNKVAAELFDIYSNIEFPLQDKYAAKTDFKRFLYWTTGTTRKTTKYGKDCCNYYLKSIIKSFISGNKSVVDIWKDKELMRKCIIDSFNNENISINSKTILKKMCELSKYIKLSNISPSVFYKWIKDYSGKDLYDLKGGIFYDPCAGFGSRMLVSHVLGMKYFGLDANAGLVDELNVMAKELNIDAKIIYGDSSNKNDVANLLEGKKADLVLASPPPFNREIYSNDSKQSINLYPEEKDWYENFATKMINNCFENLKDEGVFLLKVDYDFNFYLINNDFVGFNFEDLDLWHEKNNKNVCERLIKISKDNSFGKDNRIENEDYVVCKICGRKLSRLGRHLRSCHKMIPKDYLLKNPNSLLISRKDSLRVSNENKLKCKKGKYKKRTLYKLPNGNFSKKVDKWMKEWNNNPPAETKTDASTVVIKDPWEGKIEGVDYIKCNICGYKGMNLTRHILKNHPNINYIGDKCCKSFLEKCSNGSNKRWNNHIVKIKKDKSLNKTHKNHGLTKEILEDLYLNKGMSDFCIGELYNLTDVAVGYIRNNFGIKTVSVMERLKSQENDSEILLSTASERFKIDYDKFCKAASSLNPSKTISDCRFYKTEDLKNIAKNFEIPSGYLDTKMISELLDKPRRKIQEFIKNKNIQSKGKYYTRNEYYSPDVLDLLK